jgi:hypothetical protein
LIWLFCTKTLSSTLTDGFVSWGDEIDLAPDSMYRAISQTGEWLLS